HPVEPAQPTPPSATVPPEGPPRKLDLMLHALPSASAAPGSSGGGIVLPSGPGGGLGPPGGGARRDWRPRGDVGDPITGKLRDAPKDEFPLDRVGRDEYVYKGGQFSAHISADGSVSFDDKTIRDFNGTSGSFDVNDMMMRKHGEDPYRHQKNRFLAATE